MSRWHLSRQHLSWGHLSISGIFQLFLIRFWQNFKSKFLEPISTFVHAKFVPTTFVHVRNISAVTDPILKVKVDSLDHLELIPTVMATFVQATFVLVTFVHIMNISAVNDLILGPSLTDADCHGDICPGNICPYNICHGNICPYQEYLSCHKPNFDQTLNVGSRDHLEHIPTVTKNSTTKILLTKMFN